MISLEQALERVLAVVRPVEVEELPLDQAFGRVLAEDVHSPVDLPPFDNSAMDGYAVRSADLQKPGTLRLAGKVAAGQPADHHLQPGECIRLFTGSPLPAGADAVVMQEDVTAHPDRIEFAETVRPFENVRLRGEDVKQGARLARKGDRLGSTHLGVLAACGIARVSVSRRPRAALLATGNELRRPGDPLHPGEIYESNRTLLQPLVSGAGCDGMPLPIVRDDLAATETALKQAFDCADLVISTGGVSVGEFDFVKEAFTRIGGSIDLWRVAIRPGKPFVLGTLGSKLLFGLPGNPVSALVTFLLLVRPALLKLQSADDLLLPTVHGKLVTPVNNPGDRRHFVRVRYQNGAVEPCGPQASHMLGSLTQANGLLDVPPQSSLSAGALVSVQLWT